MQNPDETKRLNDKPLPSERCKKDVRIMKKIIVYGVKNLEFRRQMEYFLDDHYEIIAYSDGHYKRDIWDGKRFILPEDLWRQEFDWILLNTRTEKARAEMREHIEAFGIPPEKIITPFLFLPDCGAKTRPDLIADVDANYHGEQRLIFGLSYSLWGIDEKRLKFPFYDGSVPSLDLYYNDKLYSYIEQTWDSTFVLKTVFWVFPYYYFDYDASRSIEQHKRGHLFSMWQLDDWHNSRDVPILHEYVENYRMFGRKTAQFYHVPKESYQLHTVCEDQKGSATLPKLFFSEHKKTEEENRALFAHFYQKIVKRGTKPILIIPPYYLDAVNPAARNAFYKKRVRFYEILKELETEIGEITVFDYAYRFAEQREFFADIRHLNEAGAREFTELINREVL